MPTRYGSFSLKPLPLQIRVDVCVIRSDLFKSGNKAHTVMVTVMTYKRWVSTGKRLSKSKSNVYYIFAFCICVCFSMCNVCLYVPDLRAADNRSFTTLTLLLAISITIFERDKKTVDIPDQKSHSSI